MAISRRNWSNDDEELYREQVEPQTNVEFLTHLMEYSRTGAIAQLFIMDAVAKHAKRIAELPIEELRKAFGPNSFMNPDAWHAAACEIHRAFEARHNN